MKVINISGGYWTGSSAVSALLEGLADIESIPVEYSCFAFGQSLRGDLGKSLEYKLFCRYHETEDCAIIRKILRHMCRKIGFYPSHLFIPRVSGIGYFGSSYVSYVKNICSLDYMNWEAKEAFESVITSLREDTDSKYVMLDQAVSAAYIEELKNDDVYHIVVNRNPLDQYLEMKPLIRSLFERNVALGLRPLGEQLDLSLSDIELFCSMRNHFDRVIDDLSGRKNVLILDFEDFVLNNLRVKTDILFPFLGLSDLLKDTNHYKPLLSAKNIGKWREGLSQTEIDKIRGSVIKGWKYQ